MLTQTTNTDDRRASVISPELGETDSNGVNKDDSIDMIDAGQECIQITSIRQKVNSEAVTRKLY